MLSRYSIAMTLSLGVMACQDVPGVHCSDDEICPEGTSCVVVAGATHCVSPEQRDQCKGLVDKTACEAGVGVPGLCHDEICLRAGCGDGFADGAEQCDGADLDGRHDCRDLGYYEPAVLSCGADCTFDITGCRDAGKCGDGIVNGTEQCDKLDLRDQDCTSAGGFYNAAGLACNDACRFDFGACTGRCGDGTVDTAAGEECEVLGTGNTVYGIPDCAALGYYRHVAFAKCNANCKVDRTICEATAGRCGDGVRDPTEECDSADLGVPNADGDPAIDCRDLLAIPGHRYYGGAISCRANCTRDTSACHAFCGDGLKNGSEACDRTDVGGQACASGYAGSVTCDDQCTTITNTCGRLGDGVINGPEECDGANVGAGVTCASFGFNIGSGQVACTGPGTLDLSSCATNGYCGDGLLQPGEDCDGADQAGLDCSMRLGTGPLDCDENCRFAFGTCQQAFWTRMTVPNPDPNSILLFADAWSSGSSSLWIASITGTVKQWDGARWHDRSLPSSAPARPQAIWGLGDTVWIASEDNPGQTTIYRWSWTTLVAGSWAVESTLPVQTRDLYGVGNTLWAATNDGVYERAASGAWSRVIGGDYYAIDGRRGVVMAAGDVLGGNNLARKVGAGPWQPLAVRDRNFFPEVSALRTVSVISADQAVFTHGNPAPFGAQPNRRSAVYWDGLTAWDISPPSGAPPSLLAVAAFATEGDDIWLASAGFDQGGRQLELYHSSGFNGEQTFGAQVAISLPAPMPELVKLVGSDAGNLWLLGDTAVAHYQGPGWHAAATESLRNVTHPDSNPFSLPPQMLQRYSFSAIAAVPGAAWMFGCGDQCAAQGNCGGPCGEPMLLENRTSGISATNFPPRDLGRVELSTAMTVDAIAIDNAGWVWVARDDLTLSAVGNVAGLVGPPPPGTGLPERAKAAWASGGLMVFAIDPPPFMFNAPAKLVVRDASGWSTLPIVCAGCTIPQLTNVTGVSGTSANDVWILSDGAVARWDGDVASPTWRIEPIGGSGPPHASGIWVASPQEAWVVGGMQGQSGNVLQVVWPMGGSPSSTAILPADGAPLAPLRGVWGQRSTDVWFVGDASEALHWDGVRLSRFPLPHGSLRAIAGGGRDDVWALGALGGLYHLTHPFPTTTAGACADAIPIYCDRDPVVVTGSVDATPVTYRLVSPIAFGPLATAHADVSVTRVGSAPVALSYQRSRAIAGQPASSPSLCEPSTQGVPPNGIDLARGDWHYVTVAAQSPAPATYTLTLTCQLSP